ncbi:MAG TPA: hypothetical protein VHX68_00400 [Planctomycetaceae bacterium]|jgi:hypothetical protein|nr:hypothetical protein [Planctomycetaceae bacterium]
MNRTIVIEYRNSTFGITSWGAAVLVLTLVLVVASVLWHVYRRRYRRAISVAISSLALLTSPIAITAIEWLDPPRRLIAFLAYMTSVMTCALVLRTWLIAGALGGLFFFVLTVPPYLTRDNIPTIVIDVACGAAVGWFVELADKRRTRRLKA